MKVDLVLLKNHSLGLNFYPEQFTRLSLLIQTIVFKHNRFNHSKSVNLARTTKTLLNRRRLHNRREFAGEVAWFFNNNNKTRLECKGSLECLFPTGSSVPRTDITLLNTSKQEPIRWSFHLH